MRDIPPEVVASWPKPNYVNPETRWDSIVIAASICLPIIVIVFICRVYSRLFISKFFGLDDWLIIPSVLSGIAYSCITLVGVKVDKHIWDIQSPSTVTNARKLVIASNLFGLLNVAFTKLSILCLYLHIAPPSRFQTAVYVILVITSAWLVALFVTNFLFCIPLHAYYEVDFTGESTCVAEVPYYVAFTSVDLLLDVLIYMLPLPVLIPLKMPRRQKVILMVVFGLGILVIVSAAVRFPSLIRVSESYDLTWELYDAALWTEVEGTVGIVCASAPALKPLVQKFIPSAFGSFISNRGTKAGEYGIDTLSRQTRIGSYAGRRATDDLGGWPGLNPTRTGKSESDVELVHELGFISGTEHIEEGRGRGIG